VKYLDNTIAEGIEGIEKVWVEGVSFDARVGVTERIWTEDGTGAPGRIMGVKAGRKGYEGLDGILGVGLGSSFVAGLRDAGVRGMKLEFKRGEEGRNNMELIQNTDKEEGVVWYPVTATTQGPSTWQIRLTRVTHGKITLPSRGNVNVSSTVFDAKFADGCGYREYPCLPQSLCNTATIWSPDP
jgi:hypothetical protein